MKTNRFYSFMRRNTLAITLTTALISTAVIGCKAVTAGSIAAEYDAWSIYCAEYGVDSDCPTSEEENRFLDSFVGSAECDSLSIVYNGHISNF